MDSGETVATGSRTGSAISPSSEAPADLRVREALRDVAVRGNTASQRGCDALRALIADISLPLEGRSLIADALAVILRDEGRLEGASLSNVAWRLWLETQTEAPPGRIDVEESSLANLLTHRGLQAWEDGERSVAMMLFTAALRLEQRSGNLHGQAADWGNLGALSAMNGDFPTAIRQLVRAWRLHRLVSDERGLAADLFHLGQIAWETGRFALSARLLGRAAALFDKQGDHELSTTAGHLSDNALRMMAVQSDSGRLN
jgi:tetratricopeptide (TPR) repeat protein